MSGAPVVIGSVGPWSGGRVDELAECVLAPNPSAMTLDGTNTWLVSAPDSTTAVLIDPGPADPRHLAAVSDAVARRGQRVATILLTHGHFDHSEGAHLFSQEFSASVSALDPQHRFGGEGLGDGDVVAQAGVELEVVGTPGHSSDSLSFLLRENGALLTGDTVLGRGTTVVAHPDGRLDEYLASLRRLQRLAQAHTATRLLPGHGPTAEDPIGLLDAYLVHREERLDQVREAIGNGASSPADIVKMVYQPIPDEVVPAALASARAQWDYLTAGAV